MIPGLVAATFAAMGCSAGELPVVARGRYVELATDRDDPICGGTVAFMDAFVETVADLLGEKLPDRVFVRYEWTDTEHGRTHGKDPRVVEDNRLLSEHALVHAVHREVWPATRPFLHEGLAVLLDSRGFTRQTWPDGKPLDPLLEADSPRDFDYYWAWYVVSQVVRDHGFSGLRDIWHAVPPDASAVEIRASYEALFGEPIEVIFEPAEILFPGQPNELVVPRATCHFAVCAGERLALEPAQAWAAAPSSCEDDVDAVGPTPTVLSGDVWSAYTIDLEPGRHRFVASGGSGATVLSCGLRCDPGDPSPSDLISVDDTRVTDIREYWPGPLRFEVGRSYDALPTDDPGGLSIERIDP